MDVWQPHESLNQPFSVVYSIEIIEILFSIIAQEVIIIVFVMVIFDANANGGMMSWPKALTVWLLIVIAESVHGIIRELFIAPTIGNMAARRIGVLTGAVIIFLITLACIRWIGAKSFGKQLEVGSVWAVLMVIFEISLGLLLGYPKERLISDYNLAEGGFMVFGLLFLLFSPAFAARVRGFDEYSASSHGTRALNDDRTFGHS